MNHFCITVRTGSSRLALRRWAELQEALADPEQLPDHELFKAVQYDDGSNEAFLRRLWRDLYGDQP